MDTSCVASRTRASAIIGPIGGVIDLELIICRNGAAASFFNLFIKDALLQCSGVINEMESHTGGTISFSIDGGFN